MNHAALAISLASLLFGGMLLLFEVGRRAGVRRMAKDADASVEGIGVMDGAVFGLLGLLLAFSFSGAGGRFDVRRQLILEETNDIGTAYLRVDLLPVGAQLAMREKFRQYLDARLATYQNPADISATREAAARSIKLQGEIWTEAVTATRAQDAHPDAAKLVLPALNSMIDITTTRTMVTQVHPPIVVFVMLAAMALVSSLLAGNGIAKGKLRNWVHILCFAAAISVSFYVILDLEYPRLGWIRVDAFDQALVDLRQTMR